MGLSLAFTGNTFLTAVRDTINDPTGSASPRFQDSTIIGYANRALVKVARELEVAIETTWSRTLATDDQELSVPANFMTDRLVQIEMSATDHRTLGYLSLDQMTEYIGRDQSKTGTPVYYWLWRRMGADLTVAQPSVVRLWPKVDATTNGKTMRVYGYKLPDAILADSLTNLVELDAEFMEAAILWAASLAMQDDREIGLSSKLVQQYELEMRKLKGLRARKSRSRRSRVRPRATGYGNRRIQPWKPYGSNFFPGW